MKTYRAANYQSSIAQRLEQPVPVWVSDDKISAHQKHLHPKVLLNNRQISGKKCLKKCYDTTHKIAKLNANPPYFHVFICLPDENIQYGRVVAVLNQGKTAERSKALGLGPSIFGCVGSNPTLVN